jgi:hypothetical protein
MQTSTIKIKGRCSGGCIPDTSGYRCSYCHLELYKIIETKKVQTEWQR